MKAVFDTKPNSGYDDTFDQYHFPTRSNYMAAALAARGDWIVLREPQRNGGRRAYVAVARVLDVMPDPLRPDHAYARLGDYLPFDVPVPFVGSGGYWETPLRAIADASRVRAYGHTQPICPAIDGPSSKLERRSRSRRVSSTGVTHA